MPKTFSPDAVNVTISNALGTHIVTGYAEGTFISVEPSSERFTPVVGAQGDDRRYHQPSKASTATITLAQVSHSNDVFFAILQNDRETLEGWFTMTIKDASGTTVFSGRDCYIQTEPTSSFSGGGTEENREWMIRIPKPSYNIGGNGYFEPDELRAVENFGGTVPERWIQSE